MDEVANLTGHYSKYSREAAAIQLDIGDQVRVSEMYQKLYKLSSIESKEIRDRLKAIADSLEDVPPVVSGRASP